MPSMPPPPAVTVHCSTPPPAESDPLAVVASVLIVDDDPHIRRLLKLHLHRLGYQSEEVDNGVDAVAAVSARRYDLMILDLDMPRMSGTEALRLARGGSADPHLKVVVVSGQGDGDHLSGLLAAGADDFLTKPFSGVQLRARAAAAVRLKRAQEQADRLTAVVARANLELEGALNSREGELVAARGALVLALAKLVEARSNETGPHLMRLQRYTTFLGEAAAASPAFAARLPAEVRQTIAQASPLHDIGKVAIPDAILNKPGKLTAEEFEVMKTHAAAGADTLAGVCDQYHFATAFLHTAREIARSHHEKWNGTGYPDGLTGEGIPLAARVVAVADVYDALRSPRVYKPAYTHAEAVGIMLNESPGHFDPHLLAVFADIHPEFDRVYADLAG
jgi:putative two-component system response regulator